MITTIYREAIAVREWLQKAPPSYRQWLQELLDGENRTLRTTDNVVYLHRSQGRAEILARLLGLEDELLKSIKER